MKLLRYGSPGQERPGLYDGSGTIRDLSSVVDDLAGETEPLNVPGTDREWPNWGRRIAAPIEDVLDSALARRLLAAVSAARAKNGQQ